MIERLRDLPVGVEGISAKGKVSAEDYRTVIWPLFANVAQEGRRLRLLYHVAVDADFTAGAVIQDARLGLDLRTMAALQRCALVSDAPWVRGAVSFFSSISPCPLRVFAESEWDQATEWLSEMETADSIPHELLPEPGVLVVRPNRKLNAGDIEAVDATVDAWLKTGRSLKGVVIHATSFPGWESVGSFLRHARFVRERGEEIQRIALVVNGKLPELVATIAERLVNARVRHFPYQEYSAAFQWTGGEAPPDTERSRGRQSPQSPDAPSAMTP